MGTKAQIILINSRILQRSPRCSEAITRNSQELRIALIRKIEGATNVGIENSQYPILFHKRWKYRAICPIEHVTVVSGRLDPPAQFSLVIP